MLQPYWGFAHTIHEPDIVRRFYPGKTITYVVFSEDLQHNWKVATLWRPYVQVAFLPYSAGVGPKGRRFKLASANWYRGWIPKAVRWVLKRTVRNGVPVVTILELNEFHPSVQYPPHDKRLLEKVSPMQRLDILYLHLMREVPAPGLHLPERSRKRIAERLQQLVPRDRPSMQYCGLYLRQRREYENHIGKLNRKVKPQDAARDGSNLECYLDGVRALNRAGYQVLMTGDIPLPDEVSQEFKGLLVDAQHAGVNEQLFYLFAATESKLFVGDTGGGIWLPGIKAIPRLVLNAYPYFHGYPHSWMFYKTVRDGTGKLVDYRRLHEQHAYDFQPEGMTIHTNTKQEITDAVVQFLGDAQQPWVEGNASDFPEQTFIHHARGKLSPAFSRLFSPKKVAA